MGLTINDLKAYVPAKDFEMSKQFYVALGFNISVGWGGTADLELGGFSFRLQNYFVEDWANNFMVVMGVDDLEAWHQRALDVVQGGQFEGARVKAPQRVDGSLVLHVIDPSGVLLIFVQTLGQS